MIGVVKSVLLIVQSTRGKEILTLSKEHVTKLSKECSTLQSAKPKISDFIIIFFFGKICNSNKNTSRSETN